MEDRIFIISFSGDNYSPYWNIYFNRTRKWVEFEGSGVDATMGLCRYIPRHENLTEEEIVDNLFDYFEED